MLDKGYSYVRFSAPKGKKGSSLERQTTDTCAGESPESWCKRNGVELDTTMTYRDLGRSAWKGKKQKELAAFLVAIEEKKVLPGSYLLVERLDRISRKGVKEGYRLIEKILEAGVSIVTLANGRVYGPRACTSLVDGLLELLLLLEQAEQYSKMLSARVQASYEARQKRARGVKRVLTANCPPWLRVVGELEEIDCDVPKRKFEVIDEKVAVVKRLFELALDGEKGLGLTRIVKRLIAEKVEPLTGLSWCRTTVRRILTDRSVLGEYVPNHRTGRAGEPIRDYFPAVVDLGVFHKVQRVMGKRKKGNVARTSRVDNLFSGLIKDAVGSVVTGGVRWFGYACRHRFEKGTHSTQLQSGNYSHGACGFPYYVFEEAILAFLREVKVADLMGAQSSGDEVFVLSQELLHIRGRIKEANELLKGKEVKTGAILEALAGLGEREEELKVKLAEAEAMQSSPLEEALGECKGLVEAARDSEKRGRLKVVLRRIVDGIWLYVIPQVRRRTAWVQVNFCRGAKRLYYIRYCPPPTNGRGGIDGYWMAGAGVLGEDEHKFNLETPACQEVLMEVTKTWRDPRGSERFETALKEGRAIYRVIPVGTGVG
jgi:DNA invertase Pin-like site-specific DNA recombinase